MFYIYSKFWERKNVVLARYLGHKIMSGMSFSRIDKPRPVCRRHPLGAQTRAPLAEDRYGDAQHVKTPDQSGKGLNCDVSKTLGMTFLITWGMSRLSRLRGRIKAGPVCLEISLKSVFIECRAVFSSCLKM